MKLEQPCIKTVAKLKREFENPNTTVDDYTHADAVLAAIVDASRSVSRVHNFGELHRDRVSVPHRAATARIASNETGIRGIRSLVANMCGSTSLAVLNVGGRALFNVNAGRIRRFILYPGMPFEICLQRIEDLPEDESERAESIRALRFLQSPTAHTQRGASHIIWTSKVKSDGRAVEPQLVNAERVEPISIVSVPMARRGRTQTLAQIVARMMLIERQYQRKGEADDAAAERLFHQRAGELARERDLREYP